MPISLLMISFFPRLFRLGPTLPVTLRPQTPEPLGSQAVVTCMKLPRVAVRDVGYVRYGKEGPVTVLYTIQW